MGRLQRKKPESKKRKKRVGADHSAADPAVKTGSEKKTLPLAGFSKDMQKKQFLSGKLFSAGKKPIKAPQGDTLPAKGIQFLREVRIELKKVTWPPRNQVVGSTVVVIILVMIISMFLGVVDIGLSNLVRIVLR